MPILLTIFLSIFCCWAQVSDQQPEKESTDDLRGGMVLFSLEEVGVKKVHLLERTSSMDYFLRVKNDGKEVVKKIASREAKKLDMNFASRFLRCQYEIPSGPGDCKVTLRLIMKGESQEICAKDESKTQEFASFLTELQKYF